MHRALQICGAVGCRRQRSVRGIFLGFGSLYLLFQLKVLLEEILVDSHGFIETHALQVLFCDVYLWVHALNVRYYYDLYLFLYFYIM